LEQKLVHKADSAYQLESYLDEKTKDKLKEIMNIRER